ncbi:hypothetical protein HMPREF1572_01419, partial [Gardnerella vaginalis JCP7275]
TFARLDRANDTKHQNSVQTHYSFACLCSAFVSRHAVNSVQSHYMVA